MNRNQLVTLALPALLAFLAIGAGAALLILAWAPTLSPTRQVAFLGSLFALSGAVVVAAVVWAAGRP